MKTEPSTMDHVKLYAHEFMKRHYPDEALSFDIAWETFVQALQSGAAAQSRRPAARDLRRPTVRGTESPSARMGQYGVIMAPRVIHAFYLLFTTVDQNTELPNTESLRQEMLELLTQKEFSAEFSVEIINFFMENRTQGLNP
jgi:hypothetical protein